LQTGTSPILPGALARVRSKERHTPPRRAALPRLRLIGSPKSGFAITGTAEQTVHPNAIGARRVGQTANREDPLKFAERSVRARGL